MASHQNTMSIGYEYGYKPLPHHAIVIILNKDPNKYAQVFARQQFDLECVLIIVDLR